MDHWFLPYLKTGLFKNNLQYVLNIVQSIWQMQCSGFPPLPIHVAETDLNIIPNRITSYRIRRHRQESQNVHCTMYVHCRKFIYKMSARPNRLNKKTFGLYAFFAMNTVSQMFLILTQHYVFAFMISCHIY
jgi:hypothetical protein